MEGILIYQSTILGGPSGYVKNIAIEKKNRPKIAYSAERMAIEQESSTAQNIFRPLSTK